MNSRLALFLLLLILAFAPTLNVYSTDYYVDPISGNDENDGLTSSSAFKSISKITELELMPGDNVFLMDGEHTNTEETVLEISESGTEDSWITIQNFPGHKPLIRFQSRRGIHLINGASYIKISGIRIQGARSLITLEQGLRQPGGCSEEQDTVSTALFKGTGIRAIGPNLTWSHPETSGNEIPHHIIVENCEIFDCTASGLAFQQADYITIKNNKIYNNSWYSINGTSAINFYQFANSDSSEGFHNFVHNNLLYGNELKVPQLPRCTFFDGNALIVDDFKHTQRNNYKDKEFVLGPYKAKTLVANNISVNNGGSGLHFFKSANVYILNNTVVANAFQNEGDNGNADLRIGQSDDFVVKNNIFVSTSRMHNISTDNTNIDYSHNFQFGPRINNALDDCEGCITEPIVFVNTDINDSIPYLSVMNSIRNVGVDLSEFISDDFLGNLRPLGGKYDIGAYEISEDVPINIDELVLEGCPAQEMAIGETIDLNAVVSPLNATVLNLEWSSSDESIALIDTSGTLIALKEGEATITVSANSGEVSVQCELSVSNIPICDNVDFNEYVISSYGENQDAGTATIQDEGATLLIEDNAWKSINKSYEVTESTVMEFDFKSTKIGEFHGIGFDINNISDDSKIFNLYGTQFFGIMDFQTYSGDGWESFLIPVGEYYTGSFDRINFVGDHDIGPGDANGFYRNLRIYEDSCSLGSQFTVSNTKPIVENLEVKVFPNPVREVLSFEVGNTVGFQNMRLEIFSFNGQKLISRELNSNITKINVSDFPSGIYHYSISKGLTRSVGKFIIR